MARLESVLKKYDIVAIDTNLFTFLKKTMNILDYAKKFFIQLKKAPIMVLHLCYF